MIDMKNLKIRVLFIGLFCVATVCNVKATDVLQDLLKRVLPGYEKQFVFKTEVLPTEED